MQRTLRQLGRWNRLWYSTRWSAFDSQLERAGGILRGTAGEGRRGLSRHQRRGKEGSFEAPVGRAGGVFRLTVVLRRPPMYRPSTRLTIQSPIIFLALYQASYLSRFPATTDGAFPSNKRKKIDRRFRISVYNVIRYFAISMHRGLKTIHIKI